MSKPKNYIVFNADFSDDSQVDSEGNIIMGPGKNVAQALISLFKDMEYETDTIDEWDDYGWEFQVRKSKYWMWCLIQNTDPWLCIAEPSSLSIPFINKESVSKKFMLFLSDLEMILKHDTRFSNVICFTKQDYENF